MQQPFGYQPPPQRRSGGGLVVAVSILGAVTVAAALAVVVVILGKGTAQSRPDATWVAPSRSANKLTCDYPRTREQHGATVAPPTIDPDVDGRDMVATVRTNRGDIVINLHGVDAPCTVASFRHLATIGFYVGISCHRLTTQGIYVLQCGAPAGDHRGGPGYQFQDENLPSATDRSPYPRGVVAMANAAPHTNGSQFFIVYRDSPIKATFPIMGEVRKGLEIVEAVASGGTDNYYGLGDGRPKLQITIEAVTVRPA